MPPVATITLMSKNSWFYDRDMKDILVRDAPAFFPNPSGPDPERAEANNRYRGRPAEIGWTGPEPSEEHKYGPA